MTEAFDGDSEDEVNLDNEHGVNDVCLSHERETYHDGG